MRSAFKAFILSGLALSMVGFMGLTPVQVGKSFSTVAEASDWSEAVLTQVIGLHGKEGQNEAIGTIEIQLSDGTILPLDPKAQIKDKEGDPISLEKFTSPSKIRFLLEKGIVREMVLIEALPR